MYIEQTAQEIMEEDRNRWKTEDGRRKLEDGSWKTEVGRLKLEGGSWKLEVRRWKLVS